MMMRDAQVVDDDDDDDMITKMQKSRLHEGDGSRITPSRDHRYLKKKKNEEKEEK